jgi:membrane protein implicated in regulation of membrane protease activity
VVDLRDVIWIVWVSAILLFVIIEVLTLEFTFLMLAVGSLGGLGVYLLGGEWWLQIGVAATLSVLLLLTIRPLLLRTMRRGADPTPSNVEALLGLEGRALTDFVDGAGLVKLSNGDTWTARLSPELGPAALPQGASITVADIAGSTAFVRPVGPTTT